MPFHSYIITWSSPQFLYTCNLFAGAAEIANLQATINATPCDVVVEGTPIDLTRILKTDKPIASVTYELEEIEPGVIEAMVKKAVS